MPPKPPDEVKTRVVTRNGTECETPSSYSKISKGSEIPVANQPKKAFFYKTSECSSTMTATRDHVGMMELIDHIGTTSKISGGIHRNTDLGVAQKSISIARYLPSRNQWTK